MVLHICRSSIGCKITKSSGISQDISRLIIPNRYNSLYTVQEVKIPVTSMKGHLAGKLWEGNKSPNETKQPIPILCLHGRQDNCGTFDHLLPLIIKNDMTIFAVDLPGHGYSYHGNNLYYDQWLEGLTTIERVLRHFGWGKVTLLGHSLGAIISYIYSGTFPKNVDKLICLDNVRPIPGKDITEAYQLITNGVLMYDQKLSSPSSYRPSYSYDEILQKVMDGRKGTLDIEGCKTLLKRGIEKVVDKGKYAFTHDIITNVHSRFKILNEQHTDTIGSKIRCPVCVVKGDPGEDFEPKENFLQAVELVRKSAERLEFHLVPGSHHFHLNNPELVAPIITKFLESS